MLADLHLHTYYSNPRWRVESILSPRDVLRIATKRGLGAIAITDHNTFAGSAEALTLQSEFPSIIIVPGEEVTSQEGDILAYGISQTIPRGLEAAETVKQIHEQGGAAVAAHPFQPGFNLYGRNIFRHSLGQECQKLPLEGVEVTSSDQKHFTHGRNQRAKLLGRQNGLALLATSDAHFSFRIGQGATAFPDSCQTWQDVTEAIRQRQCNPARELSSFFRHYSLGILNQFFGRFFLDI